MTSEQRSAKARAAWAKNRAARERLGVPTEETRSIRVFRSDAETLLAFARKSPMAVHSLIEAAGLLAWKRDSRRDCCVASLPSPDAPAGLPPPKRFPPAPPPPAL